MYASLLISLLAAFVAMLGKQWLSRYLRRSGGSVIERCGDRQQKFDGLKKWQLHFFIESLPVMLQAALFLLACGLCRRMWSINPSVAYALTFLTGLGALFYVAIGIVGASSYACPFKTPLSSAFRRLWKWIGPMIKWAFSHIRQSWAWLSTSLHSLSPPTEIPLQVQDPDGKFREPDIQDFRGPYTAPEPEKWLKPEDIPTIRATNAHDAGCVSWILRNITDPEALDMAIRLAGNIRWFDDGVSAELPYGPIVSTYEACFDPAGDLYPGSRDRAYCSGQAMLWIHTLARCKSEPSALRFPLSGEKKAQVICNDLGHILDTNRADLSAEELFRSYGWFAR